LLVAINAHQGRPSDFPLANHSLSVQALTAACLLIRKSAFRATGGFDEEYWNGYEDVDLCFKLREKGWQLVYEPASVLIHHESQSGPERFRMAQQNIERLHAKWLGKVRPDLVVARDGIPSETGAVLAPYRTMNRETKILQKIHEMNPVSASIVILTWNQLPFTKECLASIERHTPEPHEVILVDNGSTDGTIAWLREQANARENYSLIENSENLGFSKGCNQGIEAATGSHILLLNNDTVVTPGWLSGLMECLHSAADVGIVGPMTNSISGIQMVPDVSYSDTTALDGYALQFRSKYRGRRIPLRRIVGFCMLFRRELVQRVGLLDERFGSGNFEDDDYCLRAALEGYRNLVAGDVFIHHHGSASFKGNGIDFTQAMTGNHSLFSKKWSGPFPDEKLAKQILTLKTLEKAEVLFHKGEPNKGIEAILQEGIKLIPTENRFYLFLAQKLIEEKRYQDALGVLGELPSGTNTGQVSLLCAYAHQGLGDISTTQALLQKTSALDGRQAAVHNLFGVLAFHDENITGAEDNFRKATEYDPGFAEAFTNLGALAWSNSYYDEAVEFLERGFNLCPTIPDSAERFHAALQNQEQADRGINAFREARRLFPQNRRIAFLLIDLLLRNRETKRALTLIQETIIEFGIPEGLLEASLPLRDALGPLEQVNPDVPTSLSVCMIAKNEESNLPRCLASLLPLADEIIIVDTGSDDRTRDVARVFGAKVYDFPWNGDFSAARNASLSHASCRWILVMDADEVLSPLDHGRLKEMLAEIAETPHALAIVSRNYMLQVNREKWQSNDGRYPMEEAAGGWVPSTKVRIFPNRRGIIFENPIHEIVEQSIERNGIPVSDCDIPVHHYGFLDEERIIIKKQAYYDLGIKKLAEKENDVKALYELAVQAGELARYEEAAELWKRALDLNPSMDVAWFNLGYNLLMLSRFEESRQASRKALELKPGYREVITNLAMCELCIGSSDEALALLEPSLTLHPDDPNTLLMQGVSLVSSGRAGEGKKYFKTLRERQINFTGFINECADKLLTAGKIDSARNLLNLLREEGYHNQRSEEILREIAA
ncbi:MAG: glycosyltransferase, partial [Geobacteraceae bacterium]|nr:glycosyltransferase [Geobacteraceae bacterium]